MSARNAGGPPMTRASFDAQRGPDGALLIGSPSEVADKIIRHSEALGGISRISFQMNVASLPHVKMMRAIDALGAGVAPGLTSIRQHMSLRASDGLLDHQQGALDWKSETSA
jgi:hypothetical protein